MKQSILKFKPVSIISFLFFVTISFSVKAQEVITLQKAVYTALDKNLTIKQSQFTEALANEDLKQSKYNQLPNLIASPQGSFNYGRNIDPSTNQFINQRIFGLSGDLTAQVVLFQGGQLKNQILQNKLLLDADKTATAKAKNDLILNVITGYLQILNNQDLVAASKQQVSIAAITLDRAQKSFNAGNQTLADLSQAKSQVATADLNLTTAQNQLDLSLLTLKQYMEMDPSTDIVIERPDISKLTDIKMDYNAQDVITTALTTNPDIRLAEIQKDAYFAGIRVARGSYYPSVVLFGAIGSNYSDARQRIVGTQHGIHQIGTVDIPGVVEPQPVLAPFSQEIFGFYPFGSQFGDNFNQRVGVSLQIPIFNRHTARTSVNKAKIQYQNASLSAQIAKNNLSKTIIQAVLDLHAADKKYQSSIQAYQANKDAFNVVQQRYTVGLVNSLDYNTSLTNLNKSQFDMIQARYEVIFRSKVIDYYLGNPIKL